MTAPTIPPYTGASAQPTPQIVSPTQIVSLRTNKGVQLDQWVGKEQISLLWSRESRETSRCELTVASKMAITNRVPDIVPWLHWVDVFDDQGQDLLWSGPIQNFAGNRQQLTIKAFDISSLASRTRTKLTKRWDAVDPSIVANEHYAGLIQHHGLNAHTIVRPDPLGDHFDVSSKADADTMDKRMDELVQMGLHWAVVTGTVLLGPCNRKPIAALGEHHFVGEGVTITRDGSASYNNILLQSGAAKTVAKVQMGGLDLQQIVTADAISSVSNTDRAAKQYARYVAAIKDTVTLPGGSVLHPAAPISIEHLVPSARVTLEAYGSIYLMEVTSVEVTSQAGTSAVAVTLVSVDDELPELVTLQQHQQISGAQ